MNLIFQNCKGEERVIAKVETDEEAYNEMKKFCDEHNFTIHYVRGWFSPEGDRTFYDVGSRDEFFIVER